MISEEARITKIAVAAWAKRHGIQKVGRDYAFTEEERIAFIGKQSNLPVLNGAMQLAVSIGVTRNKITEQAIKLGIEKKLVNGRKAYVFTKEQKEEIRRAICRK